MKNKKSNKRVEFDALKRASHPNRQGFNTLFMNLKFELEDDLWWKAETTFPSWKGFQSRMGAYGSKDSSKTSDGKVKLVFAPEGRGTEPIATDETVLIEWFLENEPKVSKSLLTSLLQAYPALQKQYGYSEQEKREFMPNVADTNDFKKLIGLHTVFIHPLDKFDGIPYVGFEFGCTWDPEHGLGILMHGERMVEVGGADTAFLRWIAEQDAEKP